MFGETNSVIVWSFSHLLLDSGSDETFLVYVRSGRFSLRLFYVGATLVLFCLQESCCYVAILSMRALGPRFRATSGFFLNRRVAEKLCGHYKSKTRPPDILTPRVAQNFVLQKVSTNFVLKELSKLKVTSLGS